MQFYCEVNMILEIPAATVTNTAARFIGVKLLLVTVELISPI